jgi:anti-sigma regulatory factor (Ser/Thr protein kinase)
MALGITLRLAPDARAPRAARTALVEGMHLENGMAEDAALLVSEAVTNSVLHAGLSPEERIRVEAHWEGDCLRVEVCDAGRGLEARSAPTPARDGGRGLNIIAAVAERWGMLSNGQTSLWFELAG